MKEQLPRPEPKPWLRKSGDIMEQAREMMTVNDEPVTISDEDPE